MAQARQNTRTIANKRGKMFAQIACLLVGIVVLLSTAGVGIADAFGTSNLAFGVGNQTNKVNTQVAVLAGIESQSAQKEPLYTAANFNIDNSIDAIEEKVAEQIAAAAQAQKEKDEAKYVFVTAEIEKQRNTVGIPSMSDVDWSVGEEAFIEEWTARIDAFLEGYPLAGQGVTFATAAWEYGVDPRWSPAIAFIESTNGMNCFKYHNAWGWSDSSWATWEEAINDHVKGLYNRYGYTVCRTYAKMYCPSNEYNWYCNVLATMRSI